MIGQGSNEGVFSYMALGRETTFGTAVTATAALEFLSSGFKITQGKKPLEQVERRRVQSKSILMGKSIEGASEAYFYPEVTAGAFILQNALGGAITSATATGETVAGVGFSHTVDIGNILDRTFTSLTVNIRKGDSSTGKVFEYTGNRVE